MKNKTALHYLCENGSPLLKWWNIWSKRSVMWNEIPSYEYTLVEEIGQKYGIKEKEFYSKYLRKKSSERNDIDIGVDVEDNERAG